MYPIPSKAPGSKEDVPLLACYHLPLRKEPHRHLDLDLKSIGPKASYLNVQPASKTSLKLVNTDSLLLFYSDIVLVYVSVHALVAKRSRTTEDGSSGEPVQIPWEDWGPQNTRSLWLCSPEDKPLLGTSGMRLVFADHIFDFNPYDIARNLYGPSVTPVARRLRTTGTGYSGEVHREESEVQSQPSFFDVFDPVGELYMTTSMPYRQTRLGLRAYDDYNKGMYLVEEEDGPKVSEFVGLSNDTGTYRLTKCLQGCQVRMQFKGCTEVPAMVCSLITKTTSTPIRDPEGKFVGSLIYGRRLIMLYLNANVVRPPGCMVAVILRIPLS